MSAPTQLEDGAVISARSMPRASNLMSRAEIDASDGVPSMPLRGLLDHAGELLRGLPTILWVEAAIIACKQNRVGHTLEIAEAATPPGQAATLRVFLSSAALTRLSLRLDGPIDPGLLVGTTTTLKIEPSWSSRYQLGARLVDLGRAAMQSLARQRLERLRETLRREGLIDKQRRLPIPDITRIAVVHPTGAAGQGDIATELARWEKAGLCAVRYHAAAFEGASAPFALAAALRDAVEPLQGGRPDVILLVRGGGARAGLETLDHEGVVRAVAMCVVPIICGCGHAVDRGLVDDVAWRSTDTPSKAIALVARLMRTPARRGRDDMQTIMAHVARHLEAAGTLLAEQRTSITHLATTQELSARAAVAAAWANLRVAMRDATSACDRLATKQRQELASSVTAALATLDGLVRVNRDRINDALIAARQSLDRADTDERSWLTIRAMASARLDFAGADLERLYDGVIGSTATILDRAADGLATIDAIVAASSIEATLARGFALVIDREGRVVRTVTDAQQARDITLQLHDGTVAVGVKS